jgi:hypothetical protein
MTYEEAKNYKKELESKCQNAGDELNAITAGHKSAMGLTPDYIKSLPEYNKAIHAYSLHFQTLRSFNQFYVKTFKKEIAAERRNKFKK